MFPIVRTSWTYELRLVKLLAVTAKDLVIGNVWWRRKLLLVRRKAHQPTVRTSIHCIHVHSSGHSIMIRRFLLWKYTLSESSLPWTRSVDLITNADIARWHHIFFQSQKWWLYYLSLNNRIICCPQNDKRIVDDLLVHDADGTPVEARVLACRFWIFSLLFTQCLSQSLS